MIASYVWKPIPHHAGWILHPPACFDTLQCTQALHMQVPLTETSCSDLCRAWCLLQTSSQSKYSPGNIQIANIYPMDSYHKVALSAAAVMLLLHSGLESHQSVAASSQLEIQFSPTFAHKHLHWRAPASAHESFHWISGWSPAGQQDTSSCLLQCLQDLHSGKGLARARSTSGQMRIPTDGARLQSRR